MKNEELKLKMLQGKAAVNAPQSKRSARFGDAEQTRQLSGFERGDAVDLEGYRELLRQAGAARRRRTIDLAPARIDARDALRDVTLAVARRRDERDDRDGATPDLLEHPLAADEQRSVRSGRDFV